MKKIRLKKIIYKFNTKVWIILQVCKNRLTKSIYNVDHVNLELLYN
jgi:hypothetical protein